MDIAQVIIGFDLLNIHEQERFLETNQGKKLLQLLKADSVPVLSCSSYAQRNMLRQQQYEKTIRFLSAHAQEEPFVWLRRLIIKYRVARVYSGFYLLDEAQQDCLLEKPYSQALFNQPIEHDKLIWLHAFNADHDVEYIHSHVLQQCHELFGFLLKFPSLKETYAIFDFLQNKNNSYDSKERYLHEKINSDWPVQSTFFQSISKNVINSLGWLLQNPAQITKEYADKIANAHVIYRFLGLSSENVVFGLSMEGAPLPILNILDMYNLHRNRETISETLRIWYTLKIPLNSFFAEYNEIGRFEKKPLLICLRAFMPFLVMAFFLTLGYTILLPLAVHEFLEYLLFFPTLYLSIAAAGLYVQYKNIAYAAAIEWWYGGIYQSPWFQSNKRIEEAFSNQEISERVAAYYVDC